LQITERRIPYKFGDTIKLKPFFDVHAGVKACDIQAFKKDLQKVDDKTYLIFGGDMLDSIHSRDPRYRKSNDIYEGDAIIDNQINDMIELLEPYKDRILGLMVGNHEDEITKRCGTNPIDRMSKALAVPNLGYSGLFKLVFSENGSRGRTVVIRYHHGYGGGSRTQGANITKFSKDMQYFDADLFVYGHVHSRQVDEIPRLGLSGMKLVAKPKILCICGTYLKTYISGTDPTYSEVKGYPPVSIGSVAIDITPDSKWVKMRAYVD